MQALSDRVLLSRRTWPEVQSYLDDVQTGIIIPIGSTEQHGPNGPIATDALCAEIVANSVAEETGALVGPTISIGMAQHHLSFPGSISLRPSTLMLVIQDYVSSLFRQGFRQFYFVNGHGGNIPSIRAAFDEIYAASSLSPSPNLGIPHCKLANWWDPPEVEKLCIEIFGDADGSHATPSEFSLVAALDETLLRPISFDTIAASSTFTDAEDFSRNFPDGRVGSNPTLASADHGKRILEMIRTHLSADYQNFIQSRK